MVKVLFLIIQMLTEHVDVEKVFHFKLIYMSYTEEELKKELEKNKYSLKSGFDFFLGYSPERVNPGDKVHTIDKIDKVVSGQNKMVETTLIEIYSKLTKGKVFLAKNIKVAEASKVIENSQRDINIAFVNELAKIFNLLEDDLSVSQLNGLENL